MKIKALVPFSTGTISMEQYEVKDVEDTLGAQLVAASVAIEIGGDSGGLPPVTASDAGKVLAVQSVTTKGAVIVPEQKKMIQNTYTVLDDADASLFTDGASVIVSIASTSETVERTATVASGEISVADIADGVTITIAKDGDAIKAKYSGTGLGVERTISVNLADNSGVWGAQEPIGKKFIVTLTPTSADYSGTMDKTVAEMTEAYNAGMQIVWRIILASNAYVDVNVTAVMTNEGYDYPSFNAYVIELGSGVLMYAYIPITDDGTTQTYSTAVYTLTPAT